MRTLWPNLQHSIMRSTLRLSATSASATSRATGKSSQCSEAGSPGCTRRRFWYIDSVKKGVKGAITAHTVRSTSYSTDSAMLVSSTPRAPWHKSEKGAGNGAGGIQSRRFANGRAAGLQARRRRAKQANNCRQPAAHRRLPPSSPHHWQRRQLSDSTNTFVKECIPRVWVGDSVSIM